PALPLYYALQEALRIIREEGLARRIARHHRSSRAVQAAAQALGLPLFPQAIPPSHPSHTVTALRAPEGKGEELKAAIKRRGVVVAGGQDHLKGRIIRIATMGNTPARDLLRAIRALEDGLAEVCHPVERGAGAEAARKQLRPDL
ncbi:MAG: alanine--glyoxylate aminotransferase family protein, partial [Euryarchaeota archaeon]|nr:alanine--glyoxylate aminotransferase family protein [Euryarchaeota archaeon]